QFSAICDIDGISPEFLQNAAFDVIQDSSIDALSGINPLVYFALISCFKQMGNEVVVISSSHNRRNHPAFEFRIFRAFQQVVGYQHFIHRRRSLDKVKGWTCIKDVLFTVCIIEMSSMPKLMSQYKNFVHT